jgi:hypothetical protein
MDNPPEQVEEILYRMLWQAIECNIGSASKQPNDCQKRVQMPDQSLLCQESYPIVHAANFWWLSALVSEDLIFLKHAQKEERGHL